MEIRKFIWMVKFAGKIAVTVMGCFLLIGGGVGLTVFNGDLFTTRYGAVYGIVAAVATGFVFLFLTVLWLIYWISRD